MQIFGAFESGYDVISGQKPPKSGQNFAKIGALFEKFGLTSNSDNSKIAAA